MRLCASDRGCILYTANYGMFWKRQNNKNISGFLWSVIFWGIEEMKHRGFLWQ